MRELESVTTVSKLVRQKCMSSRVCKRQSLQTLIADFGEEVDSITLVAAQDYKRRVEMIYRNLLAEELVSGMNGLEKDVLEYVALAYASIGCVIDRLTTFGGQSEVISSTQALLVLDGTVGQHSFQISPVQLEFLINNRFSVPQIAQLLGVSVSTIRRRMLSFNMSIRATYSFISDTDLDGIVSDMQQQYPNWGNRQMYGYLLS